MNISSKLCRLSLILLLISAAIATAAGEWGSPNPATMNRLDATKLVFGQQPTNTTAATSIIPAITVFIEDDNDTIITSDNTTQVTLAIGTNPGSGTLNGTLTQTVVGGIATFSDLSIDKAGTGYTFAASSNPALTGAISSPFDITPGPLHHFSFATIGDQVATIPFNIAVTARDANDNTVTGFSGTVTLSADTGTIAPTTSGAFSSGVRTESVTLGVAAPGRTITVNDGSGHTGTSNQFNLTKEPTSGVLRSSLNPSTYGQAVTFRDSVSGSVPDGGTVYLSVDGAVLDSATIDGSGVASFVRSDIRGGTRAITAFYGGTSNFDTSTSNTVTQIVIRAGVTMTLTSNNNPSTYEQNVIFKATVDGSVGSPTGSVSFYDGSTLIGTGALDGDSALAASPNLTAGIHTIKAVYSGDVNFESDSVTYSQTVDKSSVTIGLTSNNNPSTYEQNVTFNVTVNNSTHTPTGTVTFYDGAALLGTVPLSGDSAAFSTSALTGGIHSIRGVYSGDGNFREDSSTITQTVDRTNATVSLSSNNNPSTFEQNVTFTAKVTEPGHTPTGSVTFYDGISSLGTVPLTGDSARISTPDLTAGVHTVKAIYSGDGNFLSDSTTIVQTVNKAPVTVALVSGSNPSVFEQNVVFKAKVDGSSHPATGSVTFYDGAASFGSAPLSGDSASVSTNGLSVGSHAIKAVYSGDSNLKSDSIALTQTVNKAHPTVTLTSSLNPSTYEESVTFKAVVQNSSHTPAGTVAFYDGATSLGTISLSGDSAILGTAALTAGSHTIKAVYSGDGSFLSDSASFVQVVLQATPTVTIRSSLDPSLFNQNVTFTAHVDNSTHIPTGSVTFYDGLTQLANVALTGDSAQVSSSTLAAGSHTIKAVYSGDANFRRDSVVTVQIVNQVGQPVTLFSNVDPSVYEQSVTFTAHVAYTITLPTGTITFYDGANSLGVVALSADSARLSTAALTAGTHQIKAVYSGDANFLKDSTTITQIVNKADPAVTLRSSLNPSNFGLNVTFTTKVNGSSHTPTGSVTFYDGSSSLGSVPLTADSARLSSAVLPAGSHTIKAVYGGDSNFKRDSTTIVQTVQVAGVTVTLTSNSNPSVYEHPVTFKAKVDNANNTPIGSVTFYDGASSLGTVTLAGDSAQFSTSTLTAGSHSIKAVYGGSSNFEADSATITQTVNKAGVTTTLTSSNNPSTFEQNVTFKAKVTHLGLPLTGTLRFYDGAVLLGTFPIAGDSAQVSTAGLFAGSHTIKVVYSGDGDFKADSSSITQTVNKKTSTTMLTASIDPTLYGQPVTFTVVVAGSVPAGNVILKDGASALDTTALDSSGEAAFTLSWLVSGIHSITASFGGDTNHLPSVSAALSHRVNKTRTTTTVTSSVNPSIHAQPVTFTATVRPVAPGAGFATGIVNFYDRLATIGTGIPDDSGRATFTTSTLIPAVHLITAEFVGDTNFTGSTSSTLKDTVLTGAYGEIADSFSRGWNLMAISITLTNYHLYSLFPSAVSPAYNFQGLYVAQTVLRNGPGYWLKFAAPLHYFLVGNARDDDTITVAEGWNMIGSLSFVIPTSSVTSDPPDIIVSRFFGYKTGYFDATTMYPMKGYWVKVSQPGRIILVSASAAPKPIAARDPLEGANSLTISDGAGQQQALYYGKETADFNKKTVSQYEMPPSCPGDGLAARFASGSMAALIDQKSERWVPVEISTGSYPAVISWKKGPLANALLKVGKKTIVLDRDGSVSIPGAGTRIEVGLIPGAGASVPKSFALEQNYPNPFNPTTNIIYALPVASNVRLKVYNQLGQLVKSLVDGAEEAGYKVVEWNAADVASGVYYLRLEATGIADAHATFTLVKKMMVMK